MFANSKGTQTFKRIPCGHKHGPGIFQYLMNRFLYDNLVDQCFVYIDDNIVLGETEDECMERTYIDINRVFADGLKLGGFKCKFLCIKVDVIGYVIEDGRLFRYVKKFRGCTI